MQIYFDNSATTPVLSAVAEIYQHVSNDCFGNPSSLHRLGVTSEKAIRCSRQAIAASLSCSENEIYFTSGGTEGNNLLLQGIARAHGKRKRHIITSPIEHPSVGKVFKMLGKEGYDIEMLPVDRLGQIDMSYLQNAIREDTLLVSIMHVNNEVGTSQKLKDISKIIRSKSEAYFHTDAVQSFGKLPIDVSCAGVDMLTVSGHKIHAPKGTGAIFIRKGIRIEPLMYGGGQENNIRPGTENVPGIAALGKATELAMADMESFRASTGALCGYIIKELTDRLPDIIVNSDTKANAPHILNLSVLGVKAEVLLHSLEEKNIYVSTGSACSSRKKDVSHVLKAIGCRETEMDSSIRLSFSSQNNMNEANIFVDTMVDIVKELRTFSRRKQ